MGYNIVQPCYISLLALIIFCFGSIHGLPQSPANKNDTLIVLSSTIEYKKEVATNENLKMVDLKKMIPGIILDLRYETENNFMHRVMYKDKPKTSFMRLAAATRLARVQKELHQQGLGLKIFDAYRPYSVTKDFWNLVHDERYVANPIKGSGHNRGIAVDLTVINIKTKKELKMPTGFDAFTDSAHHDFVNLPSDVLKNRKLLKEIMEKYGFKAFATEWWHYSLPDPEEYDVMDFSFKELEAGLGK
jgi:zinc D-Ala-D-Ala dipeptidase